MMAQEYGTRVPLKGISRMKTGWKYVLFGIFLVLVVGYSAAIPIHAHEPRPKRILLIAGTPSHPSLMHEYNAGCTLLEKCLDHSKGVKADLYLNGWPSDSHAFDGADAVFLFLDGGSRHLAIQDEHLKLLDGLMKKGVGLGCVHYAVELPADKGGPEFKEWIGGYYETNYSCNPIWEPDFRDFPRHPITRGVKPFKVRDEWYFNIRFRPDMKGITPILVAKPSDAVRDGPYVAPRGPYPHIQADKCKNEFMMWAIDRPDGGRGFGFTGGHFHLNWGDDNFRKVVLNALVWIAHAEVPKNGVESSVTESGLLANLDDKPDRKK
jgi:type 1 glutamine amidotransferase